MVVSDAAVPVSRRVAVAGTLGFVTVTAVVLAWAKWYPYWQKVPAVAGSHSLGKSILGAGGVAPDPSWQAAVEYTAKYGRAIWPALVAGLLMAASVEAFLPARRLLALFRTKSRPVAGTVSGGLLALPSMMCTCCAAPVAIGIRRWGVPVSSALAYWLGNPVLNPAALIFMAFVLPWQFIAVRVVTGVMLVFGVTLLVGRLAGAGRTDRSGGAASRGGVRRRGCADSGGGWPSLPVGVGRLCVRLLPEYLIIVLLGGPARLVVPGR